MLPIVVPFTPLPSDWRRDFLPPDLTPGHPPTNDPWRGTAVRGMGNDETQPTGVSESDDENRHELLSPTDPTHRRVRAPPVPTPVDTYMLAFDLICDLICCCFE